MIGTLAAAHKVKVVFVGQKKPGSVHERQR